MKSAILSSNISWALIRENFRRFWAIPLLSFLLYFLSGVFPILITYGDINRTASYIAASLSNLQPFYMTAHLVMPILAAVIIFRYLQGIGSTTMMHSLPFSRRKLYVSNLLSGLMLVVTPMLLNGVILLILSKPAYDPWLYQNGIMENLVNEFSRGAILQWIWQSFLIILVIYAIAVFAGLVTANPLMHLGTALGFNFLVPALFLTFVYYCSTYLFGYNLSGSWSEFALGISPFLEVFNRNRIGGTFPAACQIYYLANALLLFVLSGYLYSRRKLERASDSLAFHFMVPVICYLVAFFGMTLLGRWFAALNGDDTLFPYAGYAAGSVIFFLLGRMIVTKTPRIFNLATLKSFGVYCLVISIFLTGLQLDLTGFEKRIPASGKILAVTLDTGLLLNIQESLSGFGIRHGYYSGSGSDSSSENGKLRLTSQENIQAMRQLHQEILDHREAIETPNGSTLSYETELVYNPGQLFSLERNYLLPYSFLRSSPALKSIMESKEFKEKYFLKGLLSKELKEVSLIPNGEIGPAVPVLNKADTQELFRAMDQDFAEASFEELVSLKVPATRLSATYTVQDPQRGRTATREIYVSILATYAHTLAWLEEKGLSERLLLDEGDVSRIAVGRAIDALEEKQLYTPTSESPDGDSEIVITDKDQIRQLLEAGQTASLDHDDYYYATVFFHATDTTYADADMGTLVLYFDPTTAPEFLKKLL